MNSTNSIQPSQIESKFASLQQQLKEKHPSIIIEKAFTVVRCSLGKIDAGLCSSEEIHAKAKKIKKGQGGAKVENPKLDVKKQKIESGCMLEMNFNGDTVAIFILSGAVPKSFAHEVGLKLTEKKNTSSNARRKELV